MNSLESIRDVTRRFVLQAGFSCNARCRFCYYQESLRKGTVRDFTTKEIKAKLREGRRLGKNMVDISGGEPTIRQDIFEIIRYARDLPRNYLKKFGSKETKLSVYELGKTIEDPLYFCQDYVKNFESLRLK